MTNEIALYCMKAYSEYYSEVCEECPIYGETGTDHCFEDALEMAIKALKQSDVLREIRQELEERINNCGDGTFKDGLCEAFDIVYCKMKEFSE